MKRQLTIALSLLAMVSCNRMDRPQDNFISVSTLATKAGPASEWPCKVVMHRSTVLDNIGHSGYKPYFETWFESIGTWDPSVGKFNTQTAYPSNYDYVTMSGFAPAMQNDHGNSQDSEAGWLLDMYDNYRSIRVNYGSAGYDNSVWENIAIAGPQVGSSISPYKDERDALDFNYATFRVKFRAICSQNMTNLGVVNAYVEISPDYVPVSIDWHPETGSYYPTGDGNTEIRALLKPDNQDNIIGHDLGHGEPDYAVTDYIYLCKPDSRLALSSLHINLSLQYSTDLETYEDSTRFPGQFGTKYGREDVSVPLKTSEGVDVTSILPGQSYVVTIVFDQDSFTLIGEIEDWEDGGNVIIPVPNPQPQPTT